MRAFAYVASAYNASICEHMRMRAFASHCMRTHFSCVMRAFAYVIWASSVSVMRVYARIRMRCERFRIACARIRIACARIACECAHLKGTYACPVLYVGRGIDATYLPWTKWSLFRRHIQMHFREWIPKGRVGFQTVWNLFMTRSVINCHKLYPKPVYATSFRQFQNV